MLARSSIKSWKSLAGVIIYSILLQHRPALFMTSLMQTAWHKMAALTVVLSRLSAADF